MSQRKLITIDIVDGQVSYVAGLPEGYDVVVRDYDIPRDWDENEIEENTFEDAMGDQYQRYFLNDKDIKREP